MTNTVKTATKVQQPAFNVTADAKQVIKATERFDRASVDFSAALRVSFTHMISLAVTAGVTKTEDGCKHLARTIREAAPFREAVAMGFIEGKTVTEYAQSAARAFFHGVEFAPGLKNQPEMALPWGKTAKSEGGAGQSGGVESTDRNALDATASKLIKQCRLLSLNDLAADLLDLLIERLDGFKEAAE
jgi:hypothetical protein